MKFLGHWVQRGMSSWAVSLPAEPEQCSMHTFEQGSTDTAARISQCPKLTNKRCHFKQCEVYICEAYLGGYQIFLTHLEKTGTDHPVMSEKQRPLWGMGGGALLQLSMPVVGASLKCNWDPGSLPEWPLGPWSGQPSLKGLPEWGKSFSVLLGDHTASGYPGPSL